MILDAGRMIRYQMGYARGCQGRRVGDAAPPGCAEGFGPAAVTQRDNRRQETFLWAWSSAAGHAGEGADGWAKTPWAREPTAAQVCTCSDYLAERAEPDLGQRRRHHQNTGRPLGERSFVERLGALLGRDLLRKKPGPKPKNRD